MSGAELVALELTDLTVLQLQPGDMVVLKVKHRLSPEEKRSLREHWQRLTAGSAAEHVPVAILDEGTDIAILRGSHE